MSKKLNVAPYSLQYQQLAISFKSGNGYLDRFLKDSLSLEDWFGKTYVLLTDDNSAIVGYYNIGTGYIEQLIGEKHYKIGGSIHINCFALHEKYHGILQATTPEGKKVNLSDFLLHDCIERIFEIRKRVGFSFITLCATKQGYNLYKRNDFETLDEDLYFSAGEEDDSNFYTAMYLPLDVE